MKRTTKTNATGSRVSHIDFESDWVVDGNGGGHWEVAYRVSCFLNHGETMARCFKANSTGSKTFKTRGSAERAVAKFLSN